MEIEIYTDGGCRRNPGPAVIGIWFPGIDGRFGAYIGSKRTNNEAEYEALIQGITKAREIGYDSIKVYTDSLLMASQVNGVYQVRNQNLNHMLKRVRRLQMEVDLTVMYVPRDQNKKADEICNQIQDRLEAGETFQCDELLTL